MHRAPTEPIEEATPLVNPKFWDRYWIRHHSFEAYLSVLLIIQNTRSIGGSHGATTIDDRPIVSEWVLHLAPFHSLFHGEGLWSG